MEGIDKLNDKVQKIQEDLRKIKESVLSETQRKEKIREIKRRAENTKNELEKRINTLKDKTKEEVKALLNSLNEIINFKLSIWNSWDSNLDVSSDWKTKSWFFSEAKDWVWNQRSDVWNPDKRKEEWGKNILRTVWFAVTWVWAVALVYKWVKKLRNRAFKDDEKWDDEKPEETEQSEDETKGKKKEKKSFWNTRYWETLKRLWFGAWAVWWSYLLWRYLSNKEDKSETSTKEKIKEMQWLESDVKNLKNQASECLRLSNTYVIDLRKNKKEYDKILSEALRLQEDNKAIFDEILASNVSEKVREKVQTIKNNIDYYVNEIKEMDGEISKDVSESSNWRKSWNDLDKFESLSSSVITDETINYINSKVKSLTLDDKMKEWMRDVLDKYLALHPILKKDKNKHIVLEIDDKKEFSNMLNGLRDRLSPSLLWGENSLNWKEWLSVSSFGSWLRNLSNSMKDLDSDKYKDIIFNHFWWLIKNIVKSGWWNMTIKEYYDSISKCYPNKNADKILNDLNSSGRADKDIKDMRYPFS